MSEPIRLFFRGHEHRIDDQPTTRTLLQYLREDLHCTGTKEGCAEGDCGACTVVVGSLEQGQLHMRSVNACLQFLPSLDGKAVFTVEDLQQDAQLHPVQQALIECHAAQCGFCTPGFAMSLWDLYLRDTSQPLPRLTIDHALSGNLCRCTGYRPIIAAAQRMQELPRASFKHGELIHALKQMQCATGLHYEFGGQQFFAPLNLHEALSLRLNYPQAMLLAGGTDIALWVNKQLRDLPHIIYLGRVAELNSITHDATSLMIGASVNLQDAYQAICAHYPHELAELGQRFASLPIRHAGTLGGNLANGSPIGDSMPWLIVLGCRITLASTKGEREIALEDFYLAYQTKDLRDDEILRALHIPLPRPQQIFRTYKLAKRYDQDISAVCSAFRADFDGTHLRNVRIAFGGMAAIPKRALHAEAALEGLAWNEANLRAAMFAMTADYAPLSDLRASAQYRMRTAQNLLRRFWLETRAEAALTPAAVNVFAQP